MSSSETIQSGVPILGTYCGEIRSLPKKLPKVPERKLDQQKYQLWKETVGSGSDDKKVLDTVAKNIQRVSYQAFNDQISRCTKAFLQLKERYVAFVEPGKSQTWVTAVAMQHGLNPEMLVRFGESGAGMLATAMKKLSTFQLETLGKTEHFVIVDDGSFSGNQMANNVSRAAQILADKFGTAVDENNSPRRFHIIVPYMTDAAKKKILSLSKSGKLPAKVHLYTAENIPTLAEIFKDAPRKLDRACKLLEIADSRKSSMGLTYFDHNIPNKMSFPQGITKSGFIPQSTPVYKQAPWVKDD